MAENYFTTASNYKAINYLGRVDSAEQEIFAWDEKQTEYRRYRLEWKKAAENDYLPAHPLHVDIELSDACNLRCRMCTHGFGNAPTGGFMDNSLAFHIVDECVRVGVYSIKLNWRGEVAINKFLPEAVRYAKNNGILEVQINTNGHPKDRDIFIQCAENRLDRIIFSVDGFTAETYESIRKGADFNQLINNIHRLLAWKKKHNSKKPLVRVQMLRTKENKSQVDDFISYWTPLVDDISINDESNRGQGNSMIVGDQITVGRARCSQPFQRLTISRDGRVSPCCSDWEQHYLVGNIESDRLDDLWMNRKMAYLRDIQRSNQQNKIKCCRECWTKESYLWKTI